MGLFQHLFHLTFSTKQVSATHQRLVMELADMAESEQQAVNSGAGGGGDSGRCSGGGGGVITDGSEHQLEIESHDRHQQRPMYFSTASHLADDRCHESSLIMKAGFSAPWSISKFIEDPFRALSEARRVKRKIWTIG